MIPVLPAQAASGNHGDPERAVADRDVDRAIDLAAPDDIVAFPPVDRRGRGRDFLGAGW